MWAACRCWSWSWSYLSCFVLLRVVQIVQPHTKWGITVASQRMPSFVIVFLVFLVNLEVVQKHNIWHQEFSETMRLFWISCHFMTRNWDSWETRVVVIFLSFHDKIRTCKHDTWHQEFSETWDCCDFPLILMTRIMIVVIFFWGGGWFLAFFNPKNMILTHTFDFRQKNGPRFARFRFFYFLFLKSPDFYNRFQQVAKIQKDSFF